MRGEWTAAAVVLLSFLAAVRGDCTLSCGTQAPVGWSGNNEGPDECKVCNCTATGLACTSQVCDTDSKCTECRLTCGTIVAAGWTGRDEGPNICRNCTCRNSGLRCLPPQDGPCKPEECEPKPRKGCTLRCGNEVSHGWEGNDNGANHCNKCQCRDGTLECSKEECEPRACPACLGKEKCGGPQDVQCKSGYMCVDFPDDNCDPDNGDKECVGCCEKEEDGCTLSCGTRVPVGWSGNDEGPNHCNVCSCRKEGGLICTLVFCLPRLECPRCAGRPPCGGNAGECKEGTCVDDPNDDCDPEKGHRDCASCCVPVISPPVGCTLRCGTMVPFGWSGKDEGPNHCNDCSCNDSGLKCSLQLCSPKACPACAGKERCVPGRNDTCPVGFACRDDPDCPSDTARCEGCCMKVVRPACERSDCCYTSKRYCECHKQPFCNAVICLRPPFPIKCEDGCSLSCGTEVDHGWSGKDEGPNHCNTCKCNDGSLTCTRMGCLPHRPCPTCANKKPCGRGNECDAGYKCVDDPDDNCDPKLSTAPCPACCVREEFPDCRPSDCCWPAERHCECRSSFACAAVLCVRPPVTVKCEEGCKLACGTEVPHGWSGYDEGPNECNRCVCTDGSLGCTREACLTKSTCPVCTNKAVCGGIANHQCPHGFKCIDNPDDSCDPENNGQFCIGCCVEDDPCDPSPCPKDERCEPRPNALCIAGKPCPPYQCVKECGTQDCCWKDGMNPERYCKCRSDSSCRLVRCAHAPPAGICDDPCDPNPCFEDQLCRPGTTPSEHECIDECSGSDCCFSDDITESRYCKCRNAKPCETVRCARPPPEEWCSSCKLTCGTKVPHGWSGSDEGPNHCNKCKCDRGELTCSRQLCSRRACPRCAGKRRCGGLAGDMCPRGLICVDDPDDTCDPRQGGADCTGCCIPGTISPCFPSPCPKDERCEAHVCEHGPCRRYTCEATCDETDCCWDPTMHPERFCRCRKHEHCSTVRCNAPPPPGMDCTLSVGDVCYSFCPNPADCDFINRRDDCPAGTTCKGTGVISINSIERCVRDTPSGCTAADCCWTPNSDTERYCRCRRQEVCTRVLCSQPPPAGLDCGLGEGDVCYQFCPNPNDCMFFDRKGDCPDGTMCRAKETGVISINTILHCLRSTPMKGCTLHCGTEVPHGWSGNGEGPQYCNRCSCNNGQLICTLIFCLPQRECPMCAGKQVCRGSVLTRCPPGFLCRDDPDDNCDPQTSTNCPACCVPEDTPTPAPVLRGCRLSCGSPVPHAWTGNGEGENHCNFCTCNDGRMRCTDRACSPRRCPQCAGRQLCMLDENNCPSGYRCVDDAADTCIGVHCLGCCVKQPGQMCKLSCGTEVPHGWSGKDEGPNHCNTCKCDDGQLGCTEAACRPIPCPMCAGKPRCRYPHGRCDMGCRCIDDPDDDCVPGYGKSCPGCCMHDTPSPAMKSCKLECGTEVEHGWSGSGEGTNHCNTCRCMNGRLMCTLMHCIFKPCPICAGKAPCDGKTSCPPGYTCIDSPDDNCNAKENPRCPMCCVPATQRGCTLSCGTKVPHGWGGKDEGPNHCNSCSCQNGLLRCTLAACRPMPCPQCAGKVPCGGLAGMRCAAGYMCVDDPDDSCDPKKGGADCPACCIKDGSCSLNCGTRVRHGWKGMDEGDNHCNECTCDKGRLTCTEKACPKKPCPICAGKDMCGGIAGIPCKEGYKCIDNPDDDCDPQKGGADCGGCCVEEEERGCTLSCGTKVPHGWAGPDEGKNHCNKCTCRNGLLGCTKIGCEPKDCPVCAGKDMCGGIAGIRCKEGYKCIDNPDDDCDPKKGGADCAGCCVVDKSEMGCTLACGTKVPHGWAGPDEGMNHCNKCTCRNGLLECSEIRCIPKTCPVCAGKERCGGIQGLTCDAGYECIDNPDDDCDPQKGGADCIGCCVRPVTIPVPPERKGCVLSCGTKVPHGWKGMDEGKNHCNSCSCTDGDLGCTDKACEKPMQCPVCAGKTSCGGITGTQCSTGYTCIDDPDDDCDPKTGGADCAGCCVEEEIRRPVL